MSDVTITENEPRPARPDNSSDQTAAETRVDQVVKDLLTGDLISRPSAERVRDAADKAIKGADLSRGIRRM